MTSEQVLIEKFQILPEEKKAKVLEFVEELEKEPEVTNGNNIETNAEAKARHEKLMRFVGIGRSKSGNVSERVDEILAEGINKEEGWSLP